VTPTKRPAGDQAGYALLAVLWVTVGITALTLMITANARGAIATSRNRIALTVASWNAAACVAYARATLVDTLESEAPRGNYVVTRAWDDVDRVLREAPLPHELGCEINARAVGSRVDVNAADSETLARLLRYAGMTKGRADSTAALVTRHRPYVDRRALHLIPGLEMATVLDSVLDIEPGPISLNHAPGPVLALLPGFTERTVEAVLDARNRGAPISTFYELSRLLSLDAPGASARLPAVSVFHPESWILTVRARAGRPAVTSVLELRLAAGTGISRRRSWIE
jgi:type II secretory pathway component PulK